MPKISGKKIILYLFLLIVIIGVVFLLFNEYGFLKYNRLKSQLDSLNTKIETIEKENKKIKAEIDSLERKIPAKIEKTAREKYGMKRPGEAIIDVEEK